MASKTKDEKAAKSTLDGRDPELLRRVYEVMVLTRAVDEGAHGLVVYLRDHSRAAPVLERLRRRGVAVVLVDRYLPSMPSDAVISFSVPAVSI